MIERIQTTKINPKQVKLLKAVKKLAELMNKENLHLELESGRVFISQEYPDYWGEEIQYALEVIPMTDDENPEKFIDGDSLEEVVNNFK